MTDERTLRHDSRLHKPNLRIWLGAGLFAVGAFFGLGEVGREIHSGDKLEELSAAKDRIIGIQRDPAVNSSLRELMSEEYGNPQNENFTTPAGVTIVPGDGETVTQDCLEYAPPEAVPVAKCEELGDAVDAFKNAQASWEASLPTDTDVVIGRLGVSSMVIGSAMSASGVISISRKQ